MTHTFDSEVSLHSWLLWPTVWLVSYKGKSSCSVVFLTKKGLLECKPEWNREAVTVFSRLPSLRRLQATPPLQTSLGVAAS